MSGASGHDTGAFETGVLDGLTFEQLLERLEELTNQLSSGEVGIERAADLYEEADRVYDAARTRLEAVQARIDRLQAARPDAAGARAPE